MLSPETNIVELLKITAPTIAITSDELKATDKVATWYLDTYVLAFNPIKKVEDATYIMLRNRIINISVETFPDKPLVEAIDMISREYKLPSGKYTNLIHATFEEEREIVLACKADIDNAFTYMFLFMAHKVVSFMFDNNYQKNRFMEAGDIFNEMLLKLYDICCSFPLDKYPEGGLNNTYLFYSLKQFYRGEIAGKNDIFCYSGSSRRRIERVAYYMQENLDFDGKTSATKKDIKKATDARDSDLMAYYAMSESLSLDTIEGAEVLNVLIDPASDVADVYDDQQSEETTIKNISKVLDLTEKEVRTIIKAVVKAVESSCITETGKVRKISNRTIKAMCKQKKYQPDMVKKVLSEYAFDKTGQNIFFA